MPGLHPILLNKNVNNDESQFIMNTQALFGCYLSLQIINVIIDDNQTIFQQVSFFGKHQIATLILE